MLMDSISSAGIGSQQHLPGEHFQANILSTITKYDSLNVIIIYSLTGIVHGAMYMYGAFYRAPKTAFSQLRKSLL